MGGREKKGERYQRCHVGKSASFHLVHVRGTRRWGERKKKGGNGDDARILKFILSVYAQGEETKEKGGEKGHLRSGDGPGTYGGALTRCKNVLLPFPIFFLSLIPSYMLTL